MDIYILKAIYDNDIMLTDREISSNPEYQQSLQELDDLVTEMGENFLDEEGQKILETILDLCSEQADCLCRQNFYLGFSMAEGLKDEAKSILKYHFCAPEPEQSEQPEND
ncbi:MAG: hypothetical protein LUD18_07260, partial [Lachnospiraceae bacterium]|nr:hypothetical protein [Lachnospiraceae bacterium]